LFCWKLNLLESKYQEKRKLQHYQYRFGALPNAV
jgi:hypothetical protein